MTRSISAAIRRELIPRLLEFGFKGDFPRLLRLRSSGYDLLEFQISWRGGGFWVNLARLPKTGVEWDGKKIPVDEVSIGYVPYLSRDRLGWNGKPNEGFFSYLCADGTKDFEGCVRSVLPVIETELEPRLQKLVF